MPAMPSMLLGGHDSSHLLARGQLPGPRFARRADERHQQTETRIRGQIEKDRKGKEGLRGGAEEEKKGVPAGHTAEHIAAQEK